jgi:hypothetical protein
MLDEHSRIPFIHPLLGMLSSPPRSGPCPGSMASFRRPPCPGARARGGMPLAGPAPRGGRAPQPGSGGPLLRPRRCRWRRSSFPGMRRAGRRSGPGADSADGPPGPARSSSFRESTSAEVIIRESDGGARPPSGMEDAGSSTSTMMSSPPGRTPEVPRWTGAGWMGSAILARCWLQGPRRAG